LTPGPGPCWSFALCSLLPSPSRRRRFAHASEKLSRITATAARRNAWACRARPWRASAPVSACAPVRLCSPSSDLTRSSARRDKARRRRPDVAAEAILALRAVVRFFELGRPEDARAYAESALATLEAPQTGGQIIPPPPSVSAATLRKRKQRAAAREADNGVTSVGQVTGHVTGQSVTVTGHVTPGHASRVDQSSLFESKTLDTGETGDHARDVTGQSVTVSRPVTRISRAERPPPSDTPDAEVRAWCVERRLDPDHPKLSHFLDVQRNAATPKRDWVSAWRNYLRNIPRFEADAAPTGVRSAGLPIQRDPPGQRAWTVGKGKP
jgi:hypothetical protein